MYNSIALDLTIEKFFCPTVKKHCTTLFDITQAEKREKYGVIYRSKPAWNNTLSFSMISQVFVDYMSECSLFSAKQRRKFRYLWRIKCIVWPISDFLGFRRTSSWDQPPNNDFRIYNFFTNMYNDFFSSGKLSFKKELFLTIRNFVFFFKLRKNWGKNWRKHDSFLGFWSHDFVISQSIWVSFSFSFFEPWKLK